MQITLKIRDRVGSETPDEELPAGIRLRIVNRSGRNNLGIVLFEQDDVITNSVAWTVINDLDINRSRSVIYASEYRIGYQKVETFSETISCVPGQRIIGNEDFTMTLSGSSPSSNIIQIVSQVYTVARITGLLYNNGRLFMKSNMLGTDEFDMFQLSGGISIGVKDTTNIIEGDTFNPLSILNPTNLNLSGISSADIIITGGNPYTFTLANIVTIV
jgi:hypothetical protein